jgi:hypothetical protein
VRITEERYRHWKALREKPGFVVLMSERIHEVVDMADELARAYPNAWFGAIMAGLAYANRLDGPYHRINSDLLDWPRSADDAWPKPQHST